MENKKKKGRPKAQFDYQSIHIRLSADMHEELRKASEDTMLPMNSIIMLSLEDYFKKITAKEKK